MGLNLGEAAATMVFASDRLVPAKDYWTLRKGAMRNDAFHITNPSPRGEGCFNALEYVMRGEDAEKLAMIGAHGTATMYNDQMESVAIERAGLEHVPVSALKGYFGHTMGAAGLLETILTMKAVSDGWIPGSMGFEECGVSGKVNVCGKHMPTEKTSFVKLMSGFGGCNGALLYDWSDVDASSSEVVVPSEVSPICKHTVRILPDSIVVDGKTMPFETQGAEMLTELYRTLSPDYPRFYRMDLLSKLAFVAVELLLKEAGLTDVQKYEILLFNRSTSIMSDLKHAEAIADAESFFPSPATFVYTLPNIMVGEVAIRHGIAGSTSLCILNQKNNETMLSIIAANMAASANPNGMIAGWVDCLNKNEFEAEISIYK
jgi:3-oxoacyl-[acyl-carrier-protein] synthase-1